MKNREWYSPSPYQIDQQDACEWLREVLPDSVDLVVTDPAYSSLEKHRKVGTTTRLKKAWFPIFRNERFHELFDELYRVMKPNSHLYMFCDQETMFVAKPIGEAVGFKFWKPLVWNKIYMGMGYHYRACYEFILFFEKGKRKLNDLSIRDILEFQAVRGGYPTEKPVDLLKVLVEQSSKPREMVLDCFSGSASTGEAAVRLGRLFRGCDVKNSAVDDGMERLAKALEESHEVW